MIKLQICNLPAEMYAVTWGFLPLLCSLFWKSEWVENSPRTPDKGSQCKREKGSVRLDPNVQKKLCPLLSWLARKANVHEHWCSLFEAPVELGSSGRRLGLWEDTWFKWVEEYKTSLDFSFHGLGHWDSQKERRLRLRCWWKVKTKSWEEWELRKWERCDGKDLSLKGNWQPGAEEIYSKIQ